MWKRLTEWIRSLFAAKPATTQPSQPSPTVQTGTKEVPAVERLDTKEGWDAWRNGYPPSTRSFISTWEEAQARDKRLREQAGGAAVDHSGLDITEAKLWEVRNNLPSGTYTFTLGKRGTVIVTGFAGGYVSKVNGVPCFNYFHLFDQSGSVTLTVEVSGGWRVQVV